MGTPASAARAREARQRQLAAKRQALTSPLSPSPTTATTTDRIEIRPQPGPQEQALACRANILIAGGAAGGGKTWFLLMEAARNYTVPDYGAVFFRRIYPNITNEGGLWDESKKLYPLLGARADNGDLRWTFPSGARVKFSHLQYETDVLNWKGSQIPLLCFDQLEEFTEHQFWYMVSRNRSMCGVPPYIRATVNPVPEDDPVGGWVHRLIQWWIDPETGAPIPERNGVLRWFFRSHDVIQWFDTREHAIEGAVKVGFAFEQAMRLPKSLTFIAARLEDNKKLMEADPGYYANLMALPMVERERLYGGNWNVKPSAGRVFNRAWFELVQAAPVDTRWVRYWDKAGTENAGAYTAGVKMGFSPSLQRYYVGHVARGQWAEQERESLIKQYALLDGPSCTVWVEKEPGSGGMESARHTQIMVAGLGIPCYADKVTGDKYARAQPFAAMVQARNVSIVQGDWNDAYLAELHGFSPDGTGYKDQVDASSGGFNKMAQTKVLKLVNAEQELTETEKERLAKEASEVFQQQVVQTGYYWPG